MKERKRKGLRVLSVVLCAALLMQPGAAAFASAAKTVAANGSKTKASESAGERKSESFLNDLKATSSNAMKGGNDDLLQTATNSNAGISVMSLLPLAEVDAQLDLFVYSDEELSAIPLSTVLESLKDSAGEPVQIPEDASIVWAYFRDEDGNITSDEYHLTDRGATVDLRPQYRGNNWSYSMEMIVGSGAQLDPGNIRYNISVNMQFEKTEDAYMYLEGYTDEELLSMPVETMLGLILDSNGRPVEIADNAKIIWNHEIDENGDWRANEYHLLDNKGTVDMSRHNYSSYMMNVIAADPDGAKPGIHYNVRVRCYDNPIYESMEINLWKHNQTGSSSRVYPLVEDINKSTLLEDTDIPVTMFVETVDGYDETQEYYLSFENQFKGHSAIQTDVYYMKDFLPYYRGEKSELSGAITDQILNIGDEAQGGIAGNYPVPDSPEDDNVFCFVYSDRNTKEILAYFGVAVAIHSEEYVTEGRLVRLPEFILPDSEYEDVTDSRDFLDWNNASWNIIHNFSTEDNEVVEDEYKVEENYYYGAEERIYLKEGYSAEEEYYFFLESNSHIDKVFEGTWDTLDNIEENGYADAECSSGVVRQSEDLWSWTPTCSATFKDQEMIHPFTIFFDDGTARQFTVTAYEAIADQGDPDFNITGASGYSYGDYYIVDNSYDQFLDTYYNIGYQTVFLLDENADLSHIRPTFYTAEGVRVHSGREQFSGESVQDFSNGTVTYKATIRDQEKQYFVTFVKKEDGPKLFVNGPREREIFLTEVFENRHDILIANIGNEPLTGLKAELLDAEHVKLDDYWIVGGENNESLGAFDTAYEKDMDNLAKIRLLPDGEGNISGTLKISADGQEDVLIELRGYAGNPRITTEALDDGVKYVPYSYMIDTNNMYEWNDVIYTITDGYLPEGVELYSATGELYGVPQETGEFPITVMADFSREEFVPDYAEFTLTVKENTNANVYLETDDGYKIEIPLGKETAAGSMDFYVAGIIDRLFVSSGEINEFIDFWLNGEKLTEGVDYDKEEGSTRITIRSQTFQNKALEGANTIAAEFRVNGDRSNDLRRTAQNFRLEKNAAPDAQDPSVNPGDSGNTGSSEDDDSSHPSGSTDSDSSSGSNNSSGSNGASPSMSNGYVSQEEGPYQKNVWIQDENGWWCKNPDGTWLSDGWYKIPYNGEEKWYYFDEQGYMTTGWLYYNNQWYYLNPNADGSQGAMLTGWHYINDSWYYFIEAEGDTQGMMTAGTWNFLPYNGTIEWYHFNEKGFMETGWFSEEGKRYYLHPIPDGTRGRMYSGWHQIDGKWYYFHEESDGNKGMLMTDTFIDGYYVNQEGAWEE